MYQEIQFHPSYAVDTNEILGNNKTFFIAPESDHSSSLFEIAAILNSPLGWWFGWRFFPHMKDEALSPVGFLNVRGVSDCRSIQECSSKMRYKSVGQNRLIKITKLHSERIYDLLDWLKVEFDVAEPNTKLQNPIALESDAFVGEVRKARGKAKGLATRSPAVEETPGRVRARDRARAGAGG